MRSLIVFCVVVLSVQADYQSDRNNIIQQEILDAIGSEIILSDNENSLNEILMLAKEEEFNAGYVNPDQFPAAQHFFVAKAAIEASTVYSIIKDMPKFGALHSHDMSFCSAEFLISNITYRDNLYVCVENNTYVNFTFADPAPTDSCWILLQDLRNSIGSTEVDAKLYSVLTLVTPDPVSTYDSSTVWLANGRTWNLINAIIQYREAFFIYLYQGLQEFYDDNIMYMELRTAVPYLYELNGTIISDPMVIFPMLVEVTNQFKEDHPGYVGTKYIYTKNRCTTEDAFTGYIDILQSLLQTFPENVIGFDINGQEEKGLTLYDLREQLINISSTVKFFFHAGQTLWNGMPSDDNLIDAVLLNVTRISQSYALTKHPEVMKWIKEQNVAIELSPITSQVLLCINNMQDHAASYWFANNFPVVISSSDPGMWGAVGVSYDFYEAFMGIASRWADLHLLKKLAMNSIDYSGLNSTEKSAAKSDWEISWDSFITNSLTKYGK